MVGFWWVVCDCTRVRWRFCTPGLRKAGRDPRGLSCMLSCSLSPGTRPAPCAGGGAVTELRDCSVQGPLSWARAPQGRCAVLTK